MDEKEIEDLLNIIYDPTSVQKRRGVQAFNKDVLFIDMDGIGQFFEKVKYYAGFNECKKLSINMYEKLFIYRVIKNLHGKESDAITLAKYFYSEESLDSDLKAIDLLDAFCMFESCSDEGLAEMAIFYLEHI